MYNFPHGLEELEGIANRTDFDLGSHTKEQSKLNIRSKVKKNNDSATRLGPEEAAEILGEAGFECDAARPIFLVARNTAHQEHRRFGRSKHRLQFDQRFA